MNMLTSDNLEDLKKDAETAENPTLKRLMKAWESKQARTARKAGGLGMVAVSLAACGSDSDSDDGGEGETPEEILGNIFTLTADQDTPENLEPTGESDIEGDVFNAPTIRFDAGILNNIVSPSLQGDDILIGNEGVQDILNAELNSTFGVLTGNAPTITNVEVLNLQLIDSPALPAGIFSFDTTVSDLVSSSGAISGSLSSFIGSFTVSNPSFVAVDLKNVSGAEQIWMDSPDDESALVVYDIQAPAAIGIREATDTGYIAAYADNAFGSDAAEQTIVLDNAFEASLGVVVGGDDAISTMSLIASGDNNLTVFDALSDVEIINVDGGSSLELIDGDAASEQFGDETFATPFWEGSFSEVLEVNAGSYNGDLTISLSGADELETVATGAGDDSITIAAAHFSDSGPGTLGSVDLGGGNNTLVLTDNADTEDGSGDDVFLASANPDGRFAEDEIEALDFTTVAISGIQTLEFDGTLQFAGDRPAVDSDITLDLDGLGQVETIAFGRINTGNSSGYDFFIDNAPVDLTLEIGSITGGSNQQLDLLFDNTVNLVVNVEGDIDGELEIDGDQSAGYNENLESIIINVDGSVGSEIDVRDHQSLTSLAINVEGDAQEINVEDNIALTDMSVSVVGNVVDDIDIDDNESLTDLNISVGGNVGDDIDIRDNESLTDLSISVGGDVSGTISIGDSTVDGMEALSTLSLDIGGASSTVIENTPSLSTVNLSGGAETGFDINAVDADFGSAVTINIGTIGVDNVGGDEALDYTNNDDSVREIFKFTGDDFGDIDISAFEAGIGSNRDQIDFSEFAGVNDTDDLVITDLGSGDIEITAADGQFEGKITLDLINSDASDLDSSLVF